MSEREAQDPRDLPPLPPRERRVSGIATLISQLRTALRVRHYSQNTERAYLAWLRRFVAWSGDRHPADLGQAQVAAFLSHLSRDRVSASTQNQALSALSFLYGEVLGRTLRGARRFVRARGPGRVPTVLARDDVERLLHGLAGPVRLMAALMYGSGLRLTECCRLRVSDVDLSQSQLLVRQGKGQKDRLTLLPKRLTAPLEAHLSRIRRLYEHDVRNGTAHASSRREQSRRADSSSDVVGVQHVPWVSYWVFPASRLRNDKETGRLWRSHIHPNQVQREVAVAIRAAGIARSATCHSLRHSFAKQLFESGYDIRTIQELLGHQNVATTLIYTRGVTFEESDRAVVSPLDQELTAQSDPDPEAITDAEAITDTEAITDPEAISVPEAVPVVPGGPHDNQPQQAIRRTPEADRDPYEPERSDDDK